MSISSKINNIPVLLLFGPTGVGKTEVLFSLQELLNRSYHINIEVISADSMQVYRYMDIGTAKPDADERSTLPHWCIDTRTPDESFDVGDFVRYADSHIPEIVNRGSFPVISGGTAFYFKHFLYGLPKTPEVPDDIRILVKGLHETNGNEGCMRILESVDPVSAGRLHINDTYRICRALEVYYSSGAPLSSFDLPKEKRDLYKPLTIGLRRDRAELYDRINARVDRMIEGGLKAEVIKLVKKGYTAADPGMKGIGYREFLTKNSFEAEDISAVIEEIKRNTRRYAKRQITFFSSLDDVQWIEAGNPERTAKDISHRLMQLLDS